VRDAREGAREEEKREAERHDELYRKQRPADLRMASEDWEKFDRIGTPLNSYHASVVRLGPLEGKRVLDAGCGDGWLSVILARRGAQVEGFDVSSEAVATATARAAANGVSDRTSFKVASFYELPYPDATFDLAIGQAILHHVGDKEKAAAELHRVLKPGGRAVFNEPLGTSLMLERLRRLVPVPSEAPDDPEQWSEQFKHHQAALFEKYFDVRLEEFHLFSRLDRVISSRAARDFLGRTDRALLRIIPPLRRYARSIVVELTKRQ